MPNIGAMLKQEIARLSRREVRSVTETTRKAAAQHRRHIAALRRQVAKLERQVALLQRRTLGASPAASASAGQKMRFVAKGLRSQRARLGLSAAEYGRLVGVTAQSVYNWERGIATPRGDQLARIAALRGAGKRDVAARLAQGAAKPKKRARTKA